MYSFKNDYSEGVHPNILEALSRSNMIQMEGYGEDGLSNEAKTLIKKELKDNSVDIHFFSGGTQTNLTAIGSFLRPHEAVISAETGHILVHETGAIEATGHKVIGVDKKLGKLSSEDIEAVVKLHGDEHMVKPKLVYLSNPTELGTIYSDEELKSIRDVCDRSGLILYMDGARMGSALMSSENDLTLESINRYCDAFYIGGTKNGALLGEVLIIKKENLKTDFRYLMKQRGALLAKGRLIGIQFKELFTDNLFYNLASHANRMADLLREGIKDSGHEFDLETSTNQLFPIMPIQIIEVLEKKFSFYRWQSIDADRSVIRLVTSWATNEEAVKEFIELLKSN
ncbi:MAG: low specificity L-threonine aldolase [Clostridiales bacterium]|nr:low specificity L-threonine aldolase [Clostridiales bacterium]